MDEIRARALSARLPGLTAEQLRPLIAAAGGEPAAILTRRALDAPDLPPAARAFLASPDETALDADLAWVRVSGARILLSTDPEYPPLLAESSGAPASLYVLGSVAALASPQLAMVGSRSPTEAGRATAREFAARSEEHTSELQSRFDLVCRLLLEKKNKKIAPAKSVAA